MHRKCSRRLGCRCSAPPDRATGHRAKRAQGFQRPARSGHIARAPSAVRPTGAGSAQDRVANRPGMDANGQLRRLGLWVPSPRQANHASDDWAHAARRLEKPERPLQRTKTPWAGCREQYEPLKPRQHQTDDPDSGAPTLGTLNIWAATVGQAMRFPEPNRTGSR